MLREPATGEATGLSARETYRDDIQLLRALAVVAVVLFHLKLPGFRAGFLGVDVFFVISGYLMQRIYRPGEGARGFYFRRARRLLPAYAATVLATLAASFLITLPVEFGQVSEQVAWAAILASNIGFWAQNSYFSRAEFHPLLHLWSLGVELQFYLLFPLLWIAAQRWKAFLPALFVLSLAACLIVVGVSPKTAFFMMPLRIWEFAAGMAVAAYAGAPRRGRLGLIAGVILVASFLLPFSGAGIGVLHGHPGLLAVWVTALTAAILWFGLPAAATASWLGRCGQRIGDASYSIYLAHYPVIALWFYVPFSGTSLGAGTLAAIIAPVFLIGVASLTLYRLIDRRTRGVFTPSRAALAAVSLMGLAVVLPGLQSLRFDAADRRIFAAWQDRGAYRCGKLFRLLNPTATTCDLSTGPNGHVLLIGDSYADAVKASVVAVAGEQGYGVRFAVGNAPLRSAAQNAGWLRDQMAAQDVRATIFIYSPKNMSGDVIDQIAALTQVKPVALLLPAPVYDRSVPQHLYEVRRDPFAPLVRIHGDEDRRARMETLGLPTFDLAGAFCAPAPCALADTEGRPYYFDAGHLTLSASRRIEPIIAQAMRSIVR